jgi:hypothetical protein
MVVDGGDYQTTLTTVLYGNESAPAGTEFNVFLVRNNTFDPMDRNLVGSSNTVGTNQVVQFYGSNILRLQRGDMLSLVINDGGGTEASIKMYAWGLTALRVSPCEKP